jgi:hypothetical protein
MVEVPLHCRLVENQLTRQVCVRQPVPARKRFAVAMHWYARCQVMGDLAAMWGIGKSTANVVVHTVTQVLKSSIVS